MYAIGMTVIAVPGKLQADRPGTACFGLRPASEESAIFIHHCEPRSSEVWISLNLTQGHSSDSTTIQRNERKSRAFLQVYGRTVEGQRVAADNKTCLFTKGFDGWVVIGLADQNDAIELFWHAGEAVAPTTDESVSPVLPAGCSPMFH